VAAYYRPIDERQRARNVMAFLGTILVLWVFGLTTLQWLRISVDGTVIASRDDPATGAPRYVTEYVLRGNDGSQFSYVAGPTDGSLPRSMPIGTKVKKIAWHVNYERNGQIILESSTVIGCVMTLVGIVGALWFGWTQIVRKAQNRSV
jgi:hypothetical protein